MIDSDWAMLGSVNMDYLSLLRNREASLFIRDKDTIQKLKNHYLQFLDQCEELDPHFKIPLYSKIIGQLGRPLKSMM
jgi:phosphatidylserine/phosphatidylglycerophosphate/cardiolipin synthase-like enzyme